MFIHVFFYFYDYELGRPATDFFFGVEIFGENGAKSSSSFATDKELGKVI